jgi:phosphatidate cytidylyltransferase
MKSELKKRIMTSFLLISILVTMFISKISLIFFLILMSIYSIIEFFNINEIIYSRNRLKKLIFNLIFIIYIFFFTLIFFIGVTILNLKILVLTIILICISSDIGGYVVGKIFKGPKLSKISPNKTIYGSLGSIIFSIIVSTIIFYFLMGKISFLSIGLGIIISLSVQSGDLFISFLKRKAELKNTGSLLPGHGGILDRIDGILLGYPVGLIFTFLIHMI